MSLPFSPDGFLDVLAADHVVWWPVALCCLLAAAPPVPRGLFRPSRSA